MKYSFLILTVLIICSALLVTAQPIDKRMLGIHKTRSNENALTTQTILGDTLQISVWDNLQMQVWKWQNGYWVNQIYGTNAKGFKLIFNNDNMAGYYGGNNPTLVSNTMPDANTIVTTVSWDNVTIVQKVTYVFGSNYYNIRWDITNNTGANIDSLRFISGDDTYFNGSDYGRTYYNANNHMVFVRSGSDGGYTSLMGYYANPLTPSSSFMAGYYYSCYSTVSSGYWLPNVADSVYQDAGYVLGWSKQNLANGATWTIMATETFQNVITDTQPPTVTVIYPNGGELFTVGDQTQIQWSASDNIAVTKVDILFSRNNGASYSLLASNLSNSGYYSWTVPDSASSTCRIKVVAYDANFNYTEDISNSTFTIRSGASISVSPTAFNTSLVQGDSASQTMVISNTGTTPLTWQVGNRNLSPSITTSNVPVVTTQSYYNSAWSRSHESAVGNNTITNSYNTALHAKMAKTSSGSAKILILASTGDGVVNLETSLISTGLYADADFNAIENPTSLALSDLQPYSAVLIYNSLNFFNQQTVGDVLKQYVDGGGGVVIATYSLTTSWAIQGGILNAGYSPFIPATTTTVSGAIDLTSITQSGHPIFQGISNAPTYWCNSNYSNPTLNTGAILLAKDTYGNNLIAENASGKVVGICIYPGFLNQGNAEAKRLFANALRYVSTGSGWLGISPQSGTIPAGSSQNVTVKFKTSGLDVGLHRDTIIIVNNDQTHNPVRVPVSLTVTATMTLDLIFDQIDATRFPTINNYVSVNDPYGNSVQNLDATNFSVYEDNVFEQPISVISLTNQNIPLSVALVIDRSGSMYGTPLSDAKTAAKQFVDNMETSDRAALITFDDIVEVGCPFTYNKTTVKSAIDAVTARNNTAVYKAAMTALNMTAQEIQRKAIILLTDGDDNSSSPLTPDSVINYANRLSIPIHCIGLNTTSTADTVLTRIARLTNGRYYRAPSSTDLAQLYQRLAQQMANQYQITYTTHNPAFNGRVRRVVVNVSLTTTTTTSSDTASRIYVAPAVSGPRILKITDVPNDNGRHVYVKWKPAANDFNVQSPVLKYHLWRLDRPIGWVYAGYVDAGTPAPDSTYITIAPTIYDSSKTKGMFYSPFVVVAWTNPLAFSTSAADSGYSVDNLSPGVPSSLIVNRGPGSVVQLSWNQVTDEDLYGYTIYRSAAQNFVPSTSNRIGFVATEAYTDNNAPRGTIFYYKVTSIDQSGNESTPASASVPASVENQSGIPQQYALGQNYPNPFNPSTSIQYAVPFRSMVRILMYNTLGEQVGALANAIREPGYYTVSWQPALSSGVYYYRLDATALDGSNNKYSETRKMILMK